MTCTAEPGITFATWSAATLPRGFVPTVGAELKMITIGGAVLGLLQSTSSSVTAASTTPRQVPGDHLQRRGVRPGAPRVEHKLVFQMIDGAFGTPGILSRLKFKLIPAQPFVRMKYEKCTTIAQYEAAYRGAHRERRRGLHRLDHPLAQLPRRPPWNLRRPGPVHQHLNQWAKPYFETTAERAELLLQDPHDLPLRPRRQPRSARSRCSQDSSSGSAPSISTQHLQIAEKIAWAPPKENPTSPTAMLPLLLAFAEFMVQLVLALVRRTALVRA